MNLRADERRELSVRIDHGGAGYYFPLATDNHRLATSRALRIYQDIVRHGWDWAKKRYSREMTLAFRWLDVPLAWTYTTIHTQDPGSRFSAIEAGSPSTGGFLVTITESDQGIRRALEWCVNHMAGLRCVAAYASAAEALRASPRQRFHLALINHSLVDKPGTACLAELKLIIPKATGLLYSAYEDSEELFRTTPGGAGTYLLKRMPPTQFLEPIAGRLTAGPLLGDELVSVAWQYFRESLASMSVAGSTRPLANLTQREHEVLGLLGKGHPDKDIADQLGISIYTVHEHVRNIFDKLGAHNRTEAAVRLLQK
jgi:DNA-binding NarL/FixJ family response regulator